MPPVSRFGSGNRAAKKRTIIDKQKAFFERFFGIGSSSFTEIKTTRPIGIQQSIYLMDDQSAEVLKVAEKPAEYNP